MRCRFCDTDAPDGTYRHGACGAEFERRKAAGTCTVCGERPGWNGNQNCSRCYSADFPLPYRGYPGGGA